MDVVELAQALIRIDTSNPGKTEEPAARLVADTLGRSGVSSEVVEAAPGRCSVVSRQPGRDRTLPPLLLHCHLDVVPAPEPGWAHDPFGGDVADGFLWGRGAADMKATAAMLLALQLEIAAGAVPRRDLVFAYFADEEMGGALGAGYVVRERPDLLAGVEEALGEGGGFRMGGVYPLAVGERGMLWFRLTATGPGGHAALGRAANPLAAVAELVRRFESLTPDEEPELAHVGRRISFTPTVARAGGKENVIPDRAELVVDCRYPAGARDAAEAAVREAAEGLATVDVLVETTAIASPETGPLPDACAAAVAEVDPGAVVAPYVCPAGTDAQRLAPLGIRGYGFAPLVLPDGFDAVALWHARDERVPVDSIRRGHEVLRGVALRY